MNSKKNLTFSFMVLCVLFSLTQLSCKKESSSGGANTETEKKTMLNTLSVEAISTAHFDEVFNSAIGIDNNTISEVGIAGNAGAGIFADIDKTKTGGKTTKIDTIPTKNVLITVNSGGVGFFPKTVTVDFGNGYKGLSGKTRKGKVIITYTGRMIIPGSKATTTFENYSVDSFKIEGTHTVENKSTGTVPTFNAVLQNGKITNTNSGAWWSRNSTLTITMIEGAGTILWPLDNVYHYIYNASNVTSTGLNWTVETITPLKRIFTCSHSQFISGTAKLKANNTEALLDYGNYTTCSIDNKATITGSGWSFTFKPQ